LSSTFSWQKNTLQAFCGWTVGVLLFHGVELSETKQVFGKYVKQMGEGQRKESNNYEGMRYPRIACCIWPLFLYWTLVLNQLTNEMIPV